MTKYEEPINRPFSPLPESMVKQREDEYHYIFELGKTDLYQYIQKYNDKSIRMGYQNMKRILLDICLGLEFIHRNGYIHRDIKPDNVVLYDEDGRLLGKICDFGFAKKFNKYESHTPNIVTCWYRAPEIITGMTDYDISSDIWSLGCVLYEMIRGDALLKGIEDNPEIMIQTLIGKMPINVNKEDLISIGAENYDLITESLCKDFPSFLGMTQVELDTYTCDESQMLEELLRNMLILNPNDRINIDNILKSEYFDEYRNNIESSICDFNIDEDCVVHTIMECEQRDWLSEYIFEILDNFYIHKKDYWWYKDKILFQTIYVFDKILYLEREENISESNIGYIANDKEGTRIKFYTILYFYTKYYGSLTFNIKFSEMSGYDVDINNMYDTVDHFEERLINILSPDFETDTVYDIYTRKQKLDEETVYALILYVINGHHSGSDPYDAYRFFEEHKEFYCKAARERTNTIKDKLNHTNLQTSEICDPEHDVCMIDL